MTPLHKPLQPIIEELSPGWMAHNMPCAVCQKKHAIGCEDHDALGTYFFAPCVDCQEQGWKLIHRPTKLPERPKRWFWRYFFNSNKGGHHG